MLSNRRQKLLEAQENAKLLFKEVAARNLIIAHAYETDVNDRVYALAQEMFGIKKYWHKRIVRAGENTLCPYRENPPNLLIKENDIVFLDFGPIFDSWEADFGQTFVLGGDKDKLALQADVKHVWDLGKTFFQANPRILGRQLFAYVQGEARARGYSWGSAHCGHLIGEFPHENIPRSQTGSFITEENELPIRRTSDMGEELDWILEVHIIRPDLRLGAFHEELLTV